MTNSKFIYVTLSMSLVILFRLYRICCVFFFSPILLRRGGIFMVSFCSDIQIAVVEQVQAGIGGWCAAVRWVAEIGAGSQRGLQYLSWPVRFRTPILLSCARIEVFELYELRSSCDLARLSGSILPDSRADLGWVQVLWGRYLFGLCMGAWRWKRFRSLCPDQERYLFWSQSVFSINWMQERLYEVLLKKTCLLPLRVTSPWLKSLNRDRRCLFYVFPEYVEQVIKFDDGCCRWVRCWRWSTWSLARGILGCYPRNWGKNWVLCGIVFVVLILWHLPFKPFLQFLV